MAAAPPPPPSRPHLLANRTLPAPPRPLFQTIDREKIGSHHGLEVFAVRGKEPKDEVQIYTWKDATLSELTDLVKEVAPEARRRNAKLPFAFIYPDKRGRFVLRVVGTTNSSGKRPDDTKALAELNFHVGDYLDVAILQEKCPCGWWFIAGSLWSGLQIVMPILFHGYCQVCNMCNFRVFQCFDNRC